MKNLQTLAILLALALTLVQAEGQTQVTFRRQEMPSRLNQEIALRVYRELDLQLQSNYFDSRAEPLLASAEAFTKDAFQVSSLTRLRATTVRTDADGDVLLAEWHFSEVFGAGTLILEDTPFLSKYHFLIGKSFAGEAGISDLLLQVIAWGRKGGPFELFRAQRLHPVISLDGPPTYFYVSLPLSNTPYLANFSIAGQTDGRESLLDLRLGKTFMDSHYRVPPFVSERFPPLAHLIGEWDTARIRSELDERASAYKDRAYLRSHRDAILVAELVRRGVTKESFLDLLSSSKDKPEERAQTVFQVLEDAGQRQLILKYFKPALAAYEQMGPKAGKAVTELFGQGLHDCPAAMEPEAVRLLESRTFEAPAITYLDFCSKAPETLALLESADLGEKLNVRRDQAVFAIRQRLISQANKARMNAR